MPDNIVETLQHLLQDVIAPDVRELKVRLASLEKQMDVRFDSVEQRFVSVDQRFVSVDQKIIGLEQRMDVRFEAVDRRFEALENRMDLRFEGMEQKMDVQFQAIMAAIGESRAQSELTSVRLLAALSERVAVLEARIH